MFSYFLKSLAAYARHSLSLYLLTLLGVALGVASVLAVQIINRNAVTAFQGGIRATIGQVDLVIEGVTPSLPETVLATVLGMPGVRAAWPIHLSRVHSEQYGSLEVLGIDLSRPDWVFGESSDVTLDKVFAVQGWVAIDQKLAQRNGLQIEDSIDCSHGVRAARLVIGAIEDFSRLGPQASSRVVITDIAQAQGLFGRRGQIHRVEIMTHSDVVPAALQKVLQKQLGESVRVLTPLQQQAGVANLLGAFRLNLTALSLISLLVGLFLIYTSIQASLVRRRAEFGLLRSLGATRLQVLALILGEAVVLGFLGVGLGIPAGYWVAQQNLAAVNTTLTNIYLLRQLDQLEVSSWLFALAGLVGIGSALLGALLPALDMGRRSPRQLLSTGSLREQISRSARPLLCTGLAVMAAALTVSWIAGLDSKPAGFILGVGLLAGLPMTAPFAVVRICGAFRIRSFGLSYSLKSLADRVQNSAFAVASLGIAVMMLIGITLMVGSFRETVRVWIDTSLVADLYLTTKSWQGAGSQATLSAAVIQSVESVPGVETVDRIRSLVLSIGNERLLVSGVEANTPRSRSRYPLLAGNPPAAYRDFLRGEGVFISEPLARRRDYGVGDKISLPGISASLRVSGIIYDYTSEWGLVVMNLQRMSELFGQGEPNSLAIYLEDPARSDPVYATLSSRVEDTALQLITSGELRQNVLKIFDQTFAIVRILQVMSLLIASAGVALTLIVLSRERISELALYRALGAQRLQIFRVFVGKGLAIALLSIILGFLGGLALAGILIFVINRAYFGWTIQVHFDWIALSTELLLILSAAALASLYPAFRASRTPATELNRDNL